MITQPKKVKERQSKQRYSAAGHLVMPVHEPNTYHFRACSCPAGRRTMEVVVVCRPLLSRPRLEHHQTCGQYLHPDIPKHGLVQKIQSDDKFSLSTYSRTWLQPHSFPAGIHLYDEQCSWWCLFFIICLHCSSFDSIVVWWNNNNTNMWDKVLNPY